MPDASTESAPETTVPSDSVRPARWRRTFRGAYFAPLLVLLVIATAVATQFKITSHEGFSHAGYTFAIAGIGLAVAAFASRRPRAAEADQVRALAPQRFIEVALVLVVIGLAAFFRFYRFGAFPPGLWYDEAVNGTDAFSIIDQDHLTVWRDTNFGHSTIYFYLLIASFKLFGYTVFAMRLVPALAGLAAVVAFYFLARWLVGVVPALVATALLAVSRYAVTFSRISWEASLEPLLEIMAVLFFVKGLESRNKFYFFLAGGSLAAGLYTYLAFRIVPVIMLFFLVYVAVAQWSLIRRNIAGLIVYALSFLIVVMPLAQFALQNQDKFLARTRDVSVFKEIDARDSYAPLRENIEKSAKLVNVRGDINGRHNLPRAPMVDEVTAALFVLGLAVAIWSFRDWRKGAMAGWLVLALVPGVFTITIENPSMIRAVGAIPPVYMLAALAVGQAHRTLTPTLAGRVLFALLAVAVVGGATALNYRDFFERQAHNKDVYDAFTPGFTDIGEVVAREAGDKQVYVNVEHIGHPAIRVLARGKEFQPYLPTKDLILNSDKGDAVLIMTPKQLGMIPTLRRLYPNLRREDDVDPFGRTFFSSVTIPATDMDTLHQLSLAVRRDALDEASPTTSRSAVARTWTEKDLARGPLTAVWEGYLWVRTFPGAASFTVKSPGLVSMEIDGQAVTLNEDGSPSAPVNLTYGERRIRVVAEIDQPGDTAIGYAIDGTETTLARAAYGTSAGATGFQAIFRDGVEFVAEPAIITHIPFALGVSVARNFQAVEYRATFDTPIAGDYRFALEGSSSSQLYIDDQLIIDNGGAHGSRRAEGTATLTPGQHLMNITYLAGDIADWALYVQDPRSEFRQYDGTEFLPPTGEYVPPVLAVVRADPIWGPLGQPVEGLEMAPNGIAALPDGTIVVGSGNTLSFADPATGAITRSVTLDADTIVDIAATSDGRIVVLDSERRSLVLLNEAGEEQRRIDQAFQSASGVAVRENTAYVASAAGGLVYAVPLDTLEPEVISGKPEDFVPGQERAQQPSDIVVGADGTVYVNDFERVRVLAYREGKVVRSFPGVTGSGGQVPRMAYHRDLILITDPQNTRLVVYDIGGRLRGAFTFQLQEKVARVIGIDATDDGSIFVAAAERGVIFRLRVEISPELEALIHSP